jgi:hypothetical protein
MRGRQTAEELARPWGGVLDPVPVLHFFKSAKGADTRRQTMEELASSSGGGRDTAPVLHFFKRAAQLLP